jgi:hypothetical protein
MQEVDRVVHCNLDEVVAKIIDGEAILINLVNGVYHSMDGTGAVVWSGIEAGDTPRRIAATLCRDYDVPAEQAARDISDLIAELLEHRLVVIGELAEAPVDGEETAAAQKRSYDAPKLHTYTDMGDLLALDPPVPGFEDIAWSK